MRSKITPKFLQNAVKIIVFAHFSTVAEIEIPSLETSQSAEEATPTPGKRKRTTRGPHESKDPNAPRRPQTAYMMFTNDVRKDVRLDHPDTSVSDRAKIIGRMWADLEQTKKKVWVRYYNYKCFDKFDCAKSSVTLTFSCTP